MRSMQVVELDILQIHAYTIESSCRCVLLQDETRAD